MNDPLTVANLRQLFRTNTFEPRCVELAEFFCPDGTPQAKIFQLAATIEDTIKDWLRYEQRELELRHEAGDQRLP